MSRSGDLPGGSAAAAAKRPPPWRDVRVLRIAFQAAVVAVVALVLWTLWGNLLTNLQRQGLRTDFGYLTGPAGFSIAGSGFRPSQPIRDALVVGLTNTALVSAVGIALATVLGLVVGVARLSTNWLVARSAALYVETFRNVPVLVIIVFWSTAVILRLPRIGSAPTPWGAAVVSNRGVWLPSVSPGDGAGLLVVAALIGAVAGAVVFAWRTRRSDRTGRPHHRVLWAGGTLLVPVVAAFVATGAPLNPDLPVVDNRIVVGGVRLVPEYMAVLLGLSIYTASHIAEIVRGSIQAVPKGQTEAANALGLSGAQRLRLVVLPQALRIMIPPLANQYLNLTKNSSLGVAVAYAEVTSVTNIVIGNGNPAPQSIVVLMAIYLTFSLLISAGTNLMNRRLQVATR